MSLSLSLVFVVGGGVTVNMYLIYDVNVNTRITTNNK